MGEFLSKRKRLICILAPTVFGIFYMFLSMFNLQQSIWQGESYGAYLAHFDASQIWNFTAEANQPPLYFWALKAWAHIFGRTDFDMRFMSVFFGAIAIMFIYMWVKYKYGAKAAILSSLLLSISPLMIRFGREMQPYMMALMFVSAATYFLQLAIDNEQKRWWIIYAIVVALGLWTSYFTVFAWLAHIVYLALIYKKKIFRKEVIWTAIIACLLFVPWLPKLFGQLSARGTGISAISLDALVNYWSETLLYREASSTSGWPLVLIILASIVLIGLVAKYYKQVRMLLCMIFVPTITLILLSLTPAGLAMTPQRTLYSAASVATIGGVTIIIATNDLLSRKERRKKVKATSQRQSKIVFAVCSVILVLASICGICSAYELGSYNFDTKQSYGANILHKNIVTADNINDTPIIVSSPWLYYDLSFYDTADRQTFFLAEGQEYDSNLLLPIKDSYFGRIDNLDKFLEKHESVWYVDVAPAQGDLEFPRDGYMATQILTLNYSNSGVEYEAIRFIPE